MDKSSSNTYVVGGKVGTEAAQPKDNKKPEPKPSNNKPSAKPAPTPNKNTATTTKKPAQNSQKNARAEAEKKARKAGKQVVRGKVYVVNHKQLLKLQGIREPNPGSDYGETYVVLKLDKPISIVATKGDGRGTRRGKAKMINLVGSKAAKKYNGKYITIAVHKDYMGWPSGTSLPLGEPGTMKFDILY